jgi:hypothetical protein
MTSIELLHNYDRLRFFDALYKTPLLIPPCQDLDRKNALHYFVVEGGLLKSQTHAHKQLMFNSSLSAKDFYRERLPTVNMIWCVSLVP